MSPFFDPPQVLEYNGEFGAELVLFLPYCRWLSDAGLLHDRTISTYSGMRCFYEGLDCAEIIERPERRRYFGPGTRPFLPVTSEHTYVKKSPFHVYPDFRTKFSSHPLPQPLAESGRPLLIVHNKYNREWRGEPINFIDLPTLETIFSTLKNQFDIVYIRHGIAPVGDGYSLDRNRLFSFDDLSVVEAHPEVHLFDDLYDEWGESLGVNAFKNALYSRCHHFITVQGGGAHHIAMYDGSLMLVLHREGKENWAAYGRGYYSFMARMPPTRAICSSTQALVEALPLMVNSTLVDDRVHVSPDLAPLMEKFSPYKFCDDAAYARRKARRKARKRAAAEAEAAG